MRAKNMHTHPPDLLTLPRAHASTDLTPPPSPTHSSHAQCIQKERAGEDYRRGRTNKQTDKYFLRQVPDITVE